MAVEVRTRVSSRVTGDEWRGLRRMLQVVNKLTRSTVACLTALADHTYRPVT